MSEVSMSLSADSLTTGPVDNLLPQLVEHLRQNRTALREEWARRITDAQLLTAMTPEEIFSEATSVYDNYVEVLETGSVEALQAYARGPRHRAAAA
jgi:rsbT co-antagonist protein RsbR